MDKLKWIFPLIFPFYFFMCGHAGANQAYVTDSFQITLRTGPSTANQIIAMPSSGQAVEVLESKGDWSRVRLGDDPGNSKEGWVLSRYLMTRQPWEVQAMGLKKDNTGMKEKLARVSSELSQKTDQVRELSEKLKETAESLAKIKADYESLKEGSADYLKLRTAHEKTEVALASANKEVQGLKEENLKLRSSKTYKSLGMGALVLLMGLGIGSVVGRQGKKRRPSIYP